MGSWIDETLVRKHIYALVNSEEQIKGKIKEGYENRKKEQD